MCTAITLQTGGSYFGRNLDLEHSYVETVTVTPRNFSLSFRRVATPGRRYAMIGMAYVAEGYPLYYDATNEMGVSMAGLNFPRSACYLEPKAGWDNLASFELIPWVLCQCADLEQALALLSRVRVTGETFSPRLPPTPLHWMVAQGARSAAVEPMEDGLKVWENPVGVLTNEPPFPMQMHNLSHYMGLSREPAVNRFGCGVELEADSRGMGAMGLPGDLSSSSRFVRGAFTRLNSLCGEGEEESVSQFFHLLGSVEQQRGCVHLGQGAYEFTVYSSCCSAQRGVYYYTTYGNRQITGVDLHREDLEGVELVSYPLVRGQQIRMEN